jgi:hypothetical protein
MLVGSAVAGMAVGAATVAEACGSGVLVGDNVAGLPLQAANTEANTREATKVAATRLGRPQE